MQPFPITYALPAISRVQSVGDKGEAIVRKVRFCPMESSIFFDEQPSDELIKFMIKRAKEFEAGHFKAHKCKVPIIGFRLIKERHTFDVIASYE